MVKKLGGDGRPMDVPTGRPKDAERSDSAGSGKASSKSAAVQVNLGERPTVAFNPRRDKDEDATERSGLSFPPDVDQETKTGDSTSTPGPQQIREEGETVVWGGAHQQAYPGEAAKSGHVHPVTGWLVVVEGAGKGTAIQLGFGHNTIGRGPGMRVQLDFGDDKISRDTHAILTYDHKGNTFYIQPGKNLTYLHDEPVLAPTPLTARSVIVLGKTTLRFIPFCDDSFSWE